MTTFPHRLRRIVAGPAARLAASPLIALWVTLALSIPALAQARGGGPGGAGAAPPAPESPLVTGLVERARAIAGPDAKAFGLDALCPPAAVLPYMFALRDAPDGLTIRSEKAFDNIYHIGYTWVGTWLITTSEGLILIDAMNNPVEAETLIVPAIRRLGFDPANLKYVIVTHGHGDHFGGARYLQDTFGAKVMLSEIDWGLIENRAANAAASLPGPRRDLVATDGQELRLGDTTLRIISTPGHTPGTISFIIPARWQGQTHYVTLAGGSAMPGGNAAATQYLSSFYKLWEAGKAAGAEGVLSTHEFMMGAIEKLDAIRSLRPDQPNPLLLGREGYERFMQAQSMCMLATVTKGMLR